jgi:ribose transport system permease protein
VSTVEASPRTPKPRLSARVILERTLSQSWVITLVILIGLYIVYAAADQNALTLSGIGTLLTNGAPLVLAATGLTLVILIGGFDLSLAGVVVLGNVILATRSGDSIVSGLLGVVLVIVSGAVVGALNGFLVGYLRVQSIAATLGTFIMSAGVALIILPAPGGVVPTFISPGLSDNLGGVVPAPLIVIVLTMIAWLALRRTAFGAHMYAVGGDERAATQSGVKVAWTKFRVYITAGILYSLAGIMLSAQTASGDPTGSALFMVLTFAAVALGGARFGGGRGTAIGSIFGAGILTVMQKTLFAVGVSTFYTGIVQGVVLIAAVLIGQLSSRLAIRSGELLEMRGGGNGSEP